MFKQGYGGGGRNRTDALQLAKLALSQLSYTPLYSESVNGLEDLEVQTTPSLNVNGLLRPAVALRKST